MLQWNHLTLSQLVTVLFSKIFCNYMPIYIICYYYSALMFVTMFLSLWCKAYAAELSFYQLWESSRSPDFTWKTCFLANRGYPAKGLYLPCVSMAGRALLAGWHRNVMPYVLTSGKLPDTIHPLAPAKLYEKHINCVVSCLFYIFR